MEKSENKNTKTIETENELICKICGRPLIQEQTIGFGQETKTKLCACNPLNKSCTGRTGWGF